MILLGDNRKEVFLPERPHDVIHFRLYDPAEGSVTVDDIPVQSLDPRSLHANIGFVTQVK